MSMNIALDPTMFADSGVNSTASMIRDLQREGFQFYVSASFYDLMEGVVQREGELPYRGDQHTLDYFTTYSEIESPLETARLVTELEISRYSAEDLVEEGFEELYGRFYDALPAPEAHDNYESPYAPRGFRLADIYFEELIFSIQMSPILSRIKRTARDLKSGAAYLVELSEDYLDGLSDRIAQQRDGFQSRREAFQEEWERLEEQSRDRNNQDTDEPARRIAVLREIVKTYPDTNYINYGVKSIPPGLGSYAGAAIQGPAGAAAGAIAGRYIGLYFADP